MSRPALAALTALLALVAAPATAAPTLRAQVDSWRAAHEREILGEFETLLAMPNVATRQADIEANAAALIPMLEKRGLKARLLHAAPGTPPTVYGEMRVPGAKRTVVYYAHYDGQPVTPSQWRTPPFQPVVRDGLEGRVVDWRKTTGPLDPEWRVFARGAGDDKVSVMAILSALDALKAIGRKPSVNVKLFFEGEEEQGSPHLKTILEQNRALLKSDLWLIGDGPVHQSRQWQAVFGARGVSGVEMTFYGPIRALHSGHYGNWAPNPAAEAAEVLAAMRDSEGRIRIPGFSEATRPVSPAERAALDALPPVEADLKREFAIGRTEGPDRVLDSTMRPALNIRGFSSGKVGSEAANAVPTTAVVSIDFRLVPDLTPEKVRALTEAFLTARGYRIVHAEPDAAVRQAPGRLVRLDWEDSGYPAWRTDMTAPASKAIIGALSRMNGAPVVVAPQLGGSVPMYLFGTTFPAPLVLLPIANHDDNQHAANENLRLKNLWDGIDEYAAVLGDLKW